MKNIVVALFLGAAVVAPVQAKDQAAPAPAPAAEAAKPAFTSANSKISEILENAEAKAIVEKHMPGFSSHPQIDMAKDFSLKAVQSFAPDRISDELLAKIDADFAAMAAKK
jgi:hypothetical protein